MLTTVVPYLPAEVSVVHVAHVERLGGEGVGLHLDVSSRHLIHEAGLAHIGEATDEEGAGVRIN